MTNKKLPRGNIRARGNLKPSGGLRGVMGPTTPGFVATGSARFPGYALPINHATKPPHPYNPPPGGENAGLPEQGVPGSEWWYQPEYNRGRRT